ncbi:MAG: DinB family protein [Phycisphaerales bacterium]|nr:DinB family protein [Phycisphaerales bacterium]
MSPNLAAITRRLDAFGRSLAPIVAQITPEEARFKPPSGAWSILEIVCHLADEEVEDFRPRLAALLEKPQGEWLPIDPEAAAITRRYNEQELGAAVLRFATQRAASVAWLRLLSDPDWSASKQHSSAGTLRAGDLLASWVAHDALHQRQIAKRLFELAQRDAPGASTAYAGEWRA